VSIGGDDGGTMEALPTSGGMPDLPGVVLVLLPDQALDVAIAADGRAADGAPLAASTVVRSIPNQQVSAELTLARLGGGDAATPPDAAAPDATPDGSDAAPDATPACPTSVAFCDDFESGAIDPHWYTFTDPNTAVTVDKTFAHRGTGSFHVHVDPLAASAEIKGELGEIATFPTPSGSFFMRAFYYLPASFPTGMWFRILSTFAPSPPYDGLNVADSAGALVVEDQNTANTGLPIPTGRWLCVEWSVDTAPVAAVSQGTRLWLDGTQVLDVRESTTPAAMPLGVVDFGLLVATPPAGVPIDLWIDDVIVDFAPIGCAK
jgi:hypothetical protein